MWTCFLLVVLGLFVSVKPPTLVSGQEHLVNRVAESRLPRGEGLAKEFPGDEGIAGHPSVIFADNFEVEGSLDSWDEKRDRGGQVLSWADESAVAPFLGRRSLKVTATLGENEGGGLTKWFESAETLHIRFYTKFAPDCDYIHHFGTLRANKSLRGRDRWSGFGGAGRKPEGDERFSTALEPTGGNRRWPPPGRWNFYSYWHEMARSGDGNYWGNGFMPQGQENITRDQWICCEFMLKHNQPGEPDGEQAFWIDGELVGHWTHINWRTSPTLFANAFTLESYVTDRWTRQKVNIVYFDNVVIASEYIGPSVSTQ